MQASFTSSHENTFKPGKRTVAQEFKLQQHARDPINQDVRAMKAIELSYNSMSIQNKSAYATKQHR